VLLIETKFEQSMCVAYDLVFLRGRYIWSLELENQNAEGI